MEMPPLLQNQKTKKVLTLVFTRPVSGISSSNLNFFVPFPISVSSTLQRVSFPHCLFFLKAHSLILDYPTSAVQQECIPQAILGMDVLCQAKSGMGKSTFLFFVLLDPNKLLTTMHTRL